MGKDVSLMGVLLLATAIPLVGCGTDYGQFEAQTIDRSGSFELELDAATAFPLFTAPGEILWAPGWEPFILNGDGYEEGTVWVTTSHGHTTYWYVARYDTQTRNARYVRVTPEADAGTVDVSVRPNDQGGSTVHVTYRLTGLSESGNDHLMKQFGESDYAKMMEHWRDAIVSNRDKIDDHLGQ